MKRAGSACMRINAKGTVNASARPCQGLARRRRHGVREKRGDGRGRGKTARGGRFYVMRSEHGPE